MQYRFSFLLLVAAVAMAAAPAFAQDRSASTDLTAALVGPDGPAAAGGSEIYATGFETFTLGDVSGQDGWFAQFGNWLVSTLNPANGAQHVQGLSDGLGQSFSLSPTVAAGADNISSASANVSVAGSPLATWEFIPQSPTAALVITRIRFNPDGTIDALVSDGMGGSSFDPTGATVPAGYFEVAVEVDGTTLDFTLYINGAPAFTGLAFAGEIENVAFLGAMETGTSGSTYDYDDVQINDGPIPVEMTSFDAAVNGDAVNLTWATASETNNAGFEVQMRDTEGTFQTLGFVSGHGTTTEAQSYSYSASGLTPGTHVFRLKQVDFDGAFNYSGEVEATVGTPGTHVLSAAYPNPFNPQAQFTVSVAAEQQVAVAVYNVLGQRVADLFSGRMEANQTETLTIDGAGLASGQYVVRVVGERFSDAIGVTLMK